VIDDVAALHRSTRRVRGSTRRCRLPPYRNHSLCAETDTANKVVERDHVRDVMRVWCPGRKHPLAQSAAIQARRVSERYIPLCAVARSDRLYTAQFMPNVPRHSVACRSRLQFALPVWNAPNWHTWPARGPLRSELMRLPYS
jgi:hypothetical protein